MRRAGEEVTLLGLSTKMITTKTTATLYVHKVKTTMRVDQEKVAME
jgi:hypothetical protein